MLEEKDDLNSKLPDSDPIPEILIVDMQSVHSNNFSNEEGSHLEEEEENQEEEDYVFSTIPDSTPNLEEDFLNQKFETNKTEKRASSTPKGNTSKCCILI